MFRRHNIGISVLFVLCHVHLSQEEPNNHKCPIGFSLSYAKSTGDPICYRRKGPEYFHEAYKDCVGNLFSSGLYHDLGLSNPKDAIWTEYRSYYPGGFFFMDASPTKNFGERVDLEKIVLKHVDIEDEICIVIDQKNNFTAVKCNEKHYRYCFVKPYQDGEDISRDGCEGLKQSFRFRSPESTCLTILDGVGGSAVRATWSQARKLCSDRGGSLLYRGWRYANNPLLSNGTLPLGIVKSTDSPLLRYDALDDRSEIPQAEWNFGNDNDHEESFGAQRDYVWYLVNSSYIFYDVVCERPVPLKNLTMNITINNDDKLILSINDTIDKDDVLCHTEGFENMVKVRKKRISFNTYVLDTRKNGYYWCTHKDIMNYSPVESNKVLFVEDWKDMMNEYAIKFTLNEKYNVSNLEKLTPVWRTKLQEYIFYKTRFISLNGDTDLDIAEETLKGFKLSYSGADVNSFNFKMQKKNIKRMYIDFRTVLIHVALDPKYGIASPGTWEGIQILSIKPVLYCPILKSAPLTRLGETVSVECERYTCVGDYNEGVQWVTTASANCTTPTTTLTMTYRSMNVDSTGRSRNSTEDSGETTEPGNITNTTSIVTSVTHHNESLIPTEPTTVTDVSNATIIQIKSVKHNESISTDPTTITVVTTPPRPPPTTKPPTTTDATTTEIPTTTTAIPREEQLQQVLDDLDRLVNESQVFVNDIDEVFDQVDGILDTHDDLEIPGQLLHLLDKLGSTVQLNDTGFGKAIRPNIALLMADAQPTNPVRGFRIASSHSEQFTDNVFQFISQEPNSTVLQSDESEVVVNLPSSVSESQRRVSFVVFRNDRAFQADSVYAVNSRVLSVNIENVTHFYGGEVIDIHLSPTVNILARNESRACAYWMFLENGTGTWSQEGCTFIRATQEGMLDTCRCDHLTHFAEVLVPKAVFSEADENALEIITIVGCFLSLIGLLMVGVTALLFRSWRREYSNKIWLQLCVAIFVLVLSFICVIFIKFDRSDVGCMLLGVALHYAVLASFCWMLVAAVLAYRRLVLVFSRDASHKLLKAAAFSWGAPCAVVGILLSAAPQSYAGRFEEMTPSGSFCYPSGVGLWLTVFAPIALILLTNWILFALIVRSVFVSRRVQRHGETNDALRCASVSCMLVFLFGLPWIFGLFATNVVAAYLFTLTATFQGFVLFVFFVLGNKKTRDLWLNKLKIKQTRKVPVTSSTYTNRSAEWRGGHPPMSLEAKVTKPKVLSSQDDSRFS